MKIYIGPYKKWWGPYQIAELLCFWVKETKDEYGFPAKPKWVHDFGTRLSETPLYKICNWIESKRERTIKIRIDKYDTWSMDDTLARIILPMLLQLKVAKNGSPFVDDEDVPEHLRSSAAPPTENEWDTDDNHHKRWDWILEEMIWAFEQKLTDWESQYYSGEHDINWDPVDENGNIIKDEDDAKSYRMVFGPNDTFEIDIEKRTIHANRIANGFRLFGKYYEGLWC